MKQVILKTSQAWAKELKVAIMDPDGWDRTNFNFSYYQEMITDEEFDRRMSKSTVLMKASAPAGFKLVTCRTEGPNDEGPALELLTELGYKPCWSEKIIDATNNKWYMYKYTFCIKNDKSIKEVQDEIYALMSAKHDKYYDLHRLAQTLQEGEETNEEWYRS